PYLSELKGNFTKYKLEHIANFRSVHSIRIYELLCQWSFMGEREIEIDKLKLMLGLEDKYSRPTNFINRVIKVAVEEINRHSNINVAYGLRKTGRQITHIQLSFSINKNEKKNRISQANRLAEFVRENEKLTRGKNDLEVKQIMNRRKNDV
ncbi:MAG TPA: RepB family plasmid replication initiator protein, partial [Verrucomicrobiales bacterium]|nr:RepB family plasmid replication initiator protein [Verrucomicrobiales bacterium]